MNWARIKVNEKSEAHIASKDVRRFPLLFCTSLNADIRRADRLLTERDIYGKYDACRTRLYILYNTACEGKKGRLRTAVGRGRMRAKKVTALQEKLRVR